MKYLLVFCACAVMFFQSSCVNFTGKQAKGPEAKEQKPELISVNSLVLRVPEEVILKAGLLGNSPGELSPDEANKLLSSLKQQPGVELASLNSCVFPSGKSGISRHVTEHSFPGDKKNVKTVDAGSRFTVMGTYNSNQGTVSLTFTEENVLIPETGMKKGNFTEERMDFTTHLTVKDGYTLLIGKLFLPDNATAQSPSKKYLLFFVKAEYLGGHKQLDKMSMPVRDKMVNINALALKIPKSLAAKWGVDGTPPLNPQSSPLKKAISEYMSPQEKETLLSALLKQPEVQVISEEAVLIKNGTEGKLRYVYSGENKPELGAIIGASSEINDKNGHISFRFSPTSQMRYSSSNDISAATIDMPVCLENNHTLLIKNTLSGENQSILLLFLTAKIVGDAKK